MIMNEAEELIYLFGEFEVNVTERTLTRNGELVILSNRAFDLLLVLIENRGRLLTKNDLVAKVWEGQFVEESNLTVQISALRRALGESKNNPQYLTTVQGRGYRFIADVITEVKKDILLQSKEFQFIESEKENKTLEANEFQNIPVPKSSGSISENWKILLITGFILIISLISGSYFWRKGWTGTLAAPPNLSLKRLTNNGKVPIAALSPDGNFFVYAVSQEGKTGLWLGHIDGSEPLQLRPPETGATFQSFHFSSDGSTIYYVLTNEKYPHGELIKSVLFGGIPQELRENVGRITYSPDEKQIAFVRNDEEKGQSSLIISDINSSNERELVVSPLNQRFSSQSPAWSPDGSMISVGGGGEDGNGYKIYIVNIADGNVKPLTDSVWSNIHSTEWLKDESGLIVVGDEKDTNGATWQLYQVSYPNSTVQKLNSDLNAYGTAVSLSSDEKKMLAIQAQLIGNIWVAPADDLSKAKQVTFGSLGRLDGWHGLDWTPDGKIVYTGFIGESRTIWMMDADGGNQKQLIPNIGTNLYPSVTNDGRYLVFQSNRSGKNEIWRANIDGSDLRQLTDVDVAAQPHVSPDGKWIVYVSNTENSGTLYRISIDGGEPLQITDKRAEWMHISPDSQFIACGYNDGVEKLAILSINGGVPLKKFDIPKTANFRLGVHWTPDGKAVTYRDGTNGIWKQAIEGGKPEKLIGLPSEKIYAYGWSRDGKQFAFTRGDEIRDAVLFNNLK